MEVKLSYSDWKDEVDAKTLPYQSYNSGSRKHIVAINGALTFLHVLDQDDEADYDTNYLPSESGAFVDMDEAGRAVTRNAATIKGWGYFACHFEFTIGAGEVFFEDFEGNDISSEIDIRMFDMSGMITVDPAMAVEERYTWLPPHDYDLIAGNTDCQMFSATDVRLSVGGGMFNAASNYDVIPGYYREFIRSSNFKHIKNIRSDGRASKYMAHTTTGAPFQTNMLQFRVKHMAGVMEQKMIITMEMFRG